MSLYPEVPVYLALGLTMAVMAMAVSYMLSETAAKAKTTISSIAWIAICMALMLAFIQLFAEMMVRVSEHYAEDRPAESLQLLNHLVIVSLATIGAFALNIGALSAHYEAHFGLRFRRKT